MEETIAATATPPASPPDPREGRRVPHPRDRHLSPADQAVRYAAERRWDVFPGAWLETTGDAPTPRCSCGSPTCTAPGAHPLNDRWADDATNNPTTARILWEKVPFASVLLPTGRCFDAVDVPESAGFLALARMERFSLPRGPVTATPDGRMHFLVLPGAAKRVPALVRALGWSPGALDMATRGDGGWIAAPPTRLGTKGAVRWASAPDASLRWLPDVADILAPLAYACGREAAAARSS